MTPIISKTLKVQYFKTAYFDTLSIPTENFSPCACQIKQVLLYTLFCL